MNQLPTGLAVITGASAGIGEQFARRIAEEGRPLLLVARRKERMESLAAQLRAERGVEVWVLEADLTRPEAVDAVMAAATATGHPLGLFVNNAGFGQDGPFHAGERARQVDMVRLNVEALVALTHAALGVLVAQGSGAVLNVASVVSYVPLPTSALYAATKAFVLSFTEAVHEEVKPLGVTVTALCPGPTQTEFFDKAQSEANRPPDFLSADPDRVAADGLDAVRRGQAVRISGGTNKAILGVVRLLPRSLVRSVAGLATR